jgi:PAS domain S-box-containing protein
MSEKKVDVLIVDDRLDGLITLEAVLNFPNVNLIRALSGQQAIDLLPFHDFALILLDVQMPEMDGFQAATLIRQNERHKQTPIIFVTAINEDDRYIYKGYEAGAVDYVFKPFQPQVLRSKVAVFVDLFLKSKQLQEQAELIRETEIRNRELRFAEIEVENLRRYLSLADAIPHIVWKAKADGSFDYFNRVWMDYTGYSREESMGLGWQNAIHHDDLAKFLQAWAKAIAFRHETYEAECRIRNKKGDMRWHWVRAVPEVDEDHEIISWIGTCTEIHDRKLAEAKLIEAERVAVSANVAKTNFLANMSHEIRTPMNAILGFSELMLNPDQSSEERARCVATVQRSGHQLLKIIDEILDISKVESGRLEIEKIEVNVITLLKDVFNLMQHQAASKGLKLDCRVVSDIPDFIYSDPTRMRQILVNIIGNAIKFTDQGEIGVDVSWDNEKGKTPNVMRFRIKDSGVGIEGDHISRLFKPFMQVDSSTTRRFGGTGLGLAFSRQLARALGGDVSIESSVLGEGSTFKVEVSAPPTEKSKRVRSLAQATERSSTFIEKELMPLKGYKILLIEDSIDNQELLSHFLVKAGAKVEIAGNGKEGVTKALADDYEVVLMDIQMPLLDGYEATSQLRRRGYTRPIIALTAHAMKEEREKCLRIGCTDHLTKPISRDQLIQQVIRSAH